MISKKDFEKAIEFLGIKNSSVCIHSSMKSFGEKVELEDLKNAFLENGCTILTPTFSYDFEAPPIKRFSPNQNGIGDGSWYTQRELPSPKHFDVDSKDVSTSDMGVFSQFILDDKKSVRGNHPLNSFTSLGKCANELVSAQTWRDVYAPFDKLIEKDGFVLLMGVDLTSATIIHYAEMLAGRTLFVRWAYDENLKIVPTNVGSCSEGFNNLESALKNYAKEIFVGKSKWICFRARDMVEICAEQIKQNPNITHCEDENCDRCNDMMLGGPIFSKDFFEK